MAVRDVVQAAAGIGGAGEYIEDVFSTYLYTGNEGTQTITNGIDLDGEGGLVWIKDRSQAQSNYLFDTENGPNKFLASDLTASLQSVTNRGVTAFNSDGFNLGASAGGNRSGDDYASWTFRKAPKFFDVVTFTTDSSSHATFSHSLGATPGCVIVKSLAQSGGWWTYHRSSNGGVTPDRYYLDLQTTGGANNYGASWLTVSDTQITLPSGIPGWPNETFVAYLFAHDAGGFGDDENVISCGSFTTDGSGNATVDLGYEAQWVLVKKSSASGNWYLVDTMRGFVNGGATGGDDARLYANTSDVEYATAQIGNPLATGFFFNEGDTGTYIYIAIRRGPMKTPESGTEVFAPEYGLNASAGGQAWSAGFPVDMYIRKNPTGGTNYIASRMTGNGPYMATDSTAAENSIPYSEKLDNMDGVFTTTAYDYRTWISWMFKRAPGFMDVVAYTGTNVGVSRTLSHNLTVPAELIITKARNDSAPWQVYWDQQRANLNLAYGFSPDAYTPSTSTQFTVLQYSNTAHNHIAYLFATLAGVSKVGSYTGNGTTLNIDCGFTTGARFVLIKGSSFTHDWHVFDTARGIVAGNDPFLELNTTNAENASYDAVDPLSSGFTINQTAVANLNADGASYIFLAIA